MVFPEEVECKDVPGGGRSFHCRGFFSNIREQLCVQSIDIVASELVAAMSLKAA